MSLFEELLLTEVGLALDADDPGIENVSGEFDVLFEDEDGPTYGNNSLGSKRLYKERLAYLEQNTYTDHYNSVFNNIASGGPGKPHGYKPNSISFHHPLFKHYMKIDNDGNAIVPKIDKLTQITTGDKQYFAFNFVADAFGDFVKYINENKKNQLSEDSFLGGEISAKKAWQNYEDFYENMLNGLFRGYVSSFLRDEKENQRVVNYATFLDSFLNKYYPSIADSIPLTMTSLVESNLLSPNSTVLCVELF